MWNYLALAQKILLSGHQKADRTGTGTKSLFGETLRFDLSEGFPLLTTKKMFLKGMVEELLWFIRGETNIGTLDKAARHWWQPWASENGDLGPVYGEQLRRSRWWTTVEPRLFSAPPLQRQEGLFRGVGIVGNDKATHCNDPLDDILKPVWRDMITRCYYPGSKSYAAYGGRGVHVCDEWLSYVQFKKDAQLLNGWLLKLEYPDRYTLDKDVLLASNRYSLQTCIWASEREQSFNTSQTMPFVATDKGGTQHTFPSIGEMVRAFGVNTGAVHRCLNGALKTHHGWHSFRYLPGVVRFRELDQLGLAISMLKRQPDSRRILINLWHTPAMSLAALPCCHGAVIQFYVADGRLSCCMYQRSADYFIGVPVNIASYALLTHMIAQVCGYEVGEFIHNFGDVHIYNNHIDQIGEQLTREVRNLPRLVLNPKVDSIDGFTYADVNLEGYDPHPAIKAEVSV